MGCCSGHEDDEFKPKPSNPINLNRKCRDVLFLLFFLAFWGGMFVIGGIAIKEGIPARLQYGMDKYGQLCGYQPDRNFTVYRKDASGNETSFKQPDYDLKSKTKLYYMDPFSLLNPLTILTGKSVCVNSCPGSAKRCNLTDVPCVGNTTNGPFHVCPYVKYHEVPGNFDTIYNDLITLGYKPFDTDYIDSMIGAPWDTRCLGASALGTFISALPASVRNSTAAFSTVPVCHYRSLLLNGPCYTTWLSTTDVYNRCVPDARSLGDSKILASAADAAAASAQASASNSTSAQIAASASLKNSTASSYANGSRFERYMGDILKGILLICMAGLLGGIVLSMFWLIFLRFFAGVVAWLIVILINVLAVGCTILASQKAGLSFKGKVGEVQGYLLQDSPIDPASGDRKVWEIITYIMIGVSCLIFLFTLLMIRRIKIAVACIKVASQAMGSIPTLIFWPFFPFIVYVAFAVWWIFVASMLYTAGDIQEKRLGSDSQGILQQTSANVYASLGFGDVSVSVPPYQNNTNTPCSEDPYCYYTVTWNRKLWYSMIYHVFGFFWTTEFIIGVGHVVLAGAVASFYWARGQSSLMPSAPLWSSVGRCFRYHLGSVALGSFIIAIVQFIRLVLEYIDRKTKQQQNKVQILKFIMYCVKYCMWYLEKILKFINKNAYIMVAIKGQNYCLSALQAVKLILSNILRVAAVNIIGDFLIFLGKLSVMIGAGFIAFLISSTQYYTDADKYPDTALSSPLLPIIVSGCIAFGVATFFFQVYEMAIDTILLCFCEDCEQNNGNPAYAPKLLMDAIGTSERAMAKRRGEDPDAAKKTVTAEDVRGKK